MCLSSERSPNCELSAGEGVTILPIVSICLGPRKQDRELRGSWGRSFSDKVICSHHFKE